MKNFPSTNKIRYPHEPQLVQCKQQDETSRNQPSGSILNSLSVKLTRDFDTFGAWGDHPCSWMFSYRPTKEIELT